MRLLATERFLRDYADIPSDIRKRTYRKLRYLARDLSHPSLRAKRARGHDGVYEGSINMDDRFLSRMAESAYVLLRIGRHDILEAR